MSNRKPKYPRTSDREVLRYMNSFIGMLSGEPASSLPRGYSAHNNNVIDRGDYYEVRNGSRLYTSFKIGKQISSVNTTTEEITLSEVHQWDTGDIIFFSGDGLPAPFVEGTGYYVIKVSSKVIKLATTVANAFAGTAINITADQAGTNWVYYGEINAYEDHLGQGVAIFMLGNSVYIANKKLNVFYKVLNMSATEPTGVSSIVGYDDEAYLFSSSGIFKIVLTDDYYWMDKINKALPSTIITDVNETVTLIYGYLYIYSMALLAGTGNRSRLDADINYESGTVQGSELNKDYGEVFYQYEIGHDLTQNHSVATLTLPDGVNGVTHFPLYRTKQIGENSGGSGTDLSSVGNRRDFMLWVADVPVAKAFVVDTSTTPGTAIIVSGNKFVYGDVSCELKDTSGNTSDINSYTDENNVAISAGLATSSLLYCAIGGGRVMRCSQSGNVVTKDYGDSFTSSDRGCKLFLSDGSYRHVVKYLTASTVQVAEDTTFTNLAVTLKPTSGNFARKWNDTVPDTPQGDGRVSWEDLSLYGSSVYVPRRFFLPVPDCNIGIIDNGFAVCASRGGSKYYYSQIGDKDYHLGYYSNPSQKRKITAPISGIVVFPSKVVIITEKSTMELVLSSFVDIGRTEVGEVISELSQPNAIDPKRGVKAWQTIVFKNANLMYALCGDSSFRSFDGNVWGKDLSIQNGKDAVSKKYLRLSDQSYGVNAFVSNFAGLKLWFRRWDELTNTTGAVYGAVQYQIGAATEEQFSLSNLADRGSGLTDVQGIIL